MPCNVLEFYDVLFYCDQKLYLNLERSFAVFFIISVAMNLSNNKLIFIYSHCSPMSSSPMIGRTFVKGQGGSALIPKTVLRMNREGVANNQGFVLLKNYILKLHSL